MSNRKFALTFYDVQDMNQFFELVDSCREPVYLDLPDEPACDLRNNKEGGCPATGRTAASPFWADKALVLFIVNCRDRPVNGENRRKGGCAEVRPVLPAVV